MTSITIASAIALAKEQGVDVLDAELLLADVLAVKQTYILAHPETQLDSDQEKKILELFKRRANHEPLAYLTGVKEFFGLPIQVDKNVLVPRPESEEAIEWILEKTKNHVVHSAIDIGTGSGALACALAQKLPQAHIIALDIKEKILDVARSNAKDLNLNNITFLKSNLLKKIEPGTKFDVVIANLPYLNPDWQRDPSTQHEPTEALYASDNGLALYTTLLQELPPHLQDNALGIFEADPRNAEILFIMTQKALPQHRVELKNDLAQLPRFVTFEKDKYPVQ